MKKRAFASVAAIAAGFLLLPTTSQADGPSLETTQKFISETSQGQSILVLRSVNGGCQVEQYQEKQAVRFDGCNMYFSYDVARYYANCVGLHDTRNHVEYRAEIPKMTKPCSVGAATSAAPNARIVSCSGANLIFFGEQAAAQAPRVAKALEHAIELCKGQGVPW
jgi:hypothetical protein